MKAKHLTAAHLGQRFKLSNPARTITGGLSDYEHLTTPKGHPLATVIYLNGVQMKLHPDQALTFTTKEAVHDDEEG